MIRSALYLLLASASTVASSQTVWRCGPDGRSYADAPCAGGQVVAVADPRSLSDVAEARAVAAREQQWAQRLTAQRREREREAAMAGSGLAGIQSTAEVKPQASTPHERLRQTQKRARSTSAAGTSRAVARGSLQKLD